MAWPHPAAFYPLGILPPLGALYTAAPSSGARPHGLAASPWIGGIPMDWRHPAAIILPYSPGILPPPLDERYPADETSSAPVSHTSYKFYKIYMSYMSYTIYTSYKTYTPHK